jgi:hypothetical protein
MTLMESVVEELDAEGVLAELRKIGPQIERLETKRSALYERQNSLIIRGDVLELSAMDMARARKPKGDVKYIAESFRQKIREANPQPTRRRRKTGSTS